MIRTNAATMTHQLTTAKSAVLYVLDNADVEAAAHE